MCGITGIINFDKSPVDANILKNMTDVLAHRGPDDEGFYINSSNAAKRDSKWKCGKGGGFAGLGHRRLSIIDLSTGHQPISNEDKTIWVVYNGEIYNFYELKKELEEKGHRFSTSTDTEVIIHGYEEWGEKCVEKFRGMFAFVIWDEKSNRAFAARDRLGIKPFYYYSDNKRFVFGSELKAILQCPDIEKNIRLESLSDYLHLMYVPAPNTIYRGIKKLLPGHLLTVKDGQVIEKRYWDINFSVNSALSEKEWCERIIAKLKESVDIRLISDVPLGAFLSGGVDSSAVVALMSNLLKEPVKTASIGFNEDKFNELPFARQISKQFNTDHYEKTVTPDALEILDKLVWHFDEPFGDSSAVPTYYVSKIAREKVTVALSGDGGDENFAGYRRYYFDRLENTSRSFFPEFVRKHLISTLANIYPKADRLPQFLRAKTLLTNLSLDPAQGYYNSMSWFQRVDNLFSIDVQNRLGDYSPVSHFKKYFDMADTSDPLSKIQYIDIKTYLTDDILTKVDRTSMANSLEVRVPVLDHEFMELVAAIPSSLKLKGKESKYILKKSLQNILPDSCLYRKKMGFSIPVAKWLKNELGSVFKETVFDKNGFCSSYLNTDTIKKMYIDHADGRADFAYELWAVLFLEKWGRKWV